MIKKNSKPVLKIDNAKLKLQQEQHSKIGLVQSLKGYITNISYGFQGLTLPFFHKTMHKNHQFLAQLYVGGKKFSNEEECRKSHQELIWFTYKKNFKISLRFHSDIGWGCLIRVAQMAMAQALRRFLSQVLGNVSNSYIITPFLQSQTNAKYSVPKFVAKAELLFAKKPGDWFSITEVAMILQELHQEHPLKCSQNLKLAVCTQSVNIKKLSQLIEGFSYKDSRGFDQNMSMFSKGAGRNRVQTKKTYLSLLKSHYSSQNKNSKHVLLILIAKLGEKDVNPKNYSALLQLMKLPTFLGCLGGIPKKARFLTGIYDDKISYLDPHYVQENVQQINLANELNKFSCPQYRFMEREQLDTNIGICFYLKSLEDIQQLTKCIDRINVGQKRPFVRYQNSQSISSQIQALIDQKQEPKRKLQHEQSFSDLNQSGSMDSSFFME